MRRKTFDEKNKKWYVLALHVIVFSHISVACLSLAGYAPGFSVNDYATAFWYFASAICSALIAWLVATERLRGSYGICIVAIVNALCGWVSGASAEKSLATIAFACLFLGVLLWAGERGNQNSAERSIKIKIPWV